MIHMGDLILGILLIVAVLDGWRRGIIKILGSFGGLFVGIFIARRLTPVLLPVIAKQFDLALYGAPAHAQSALVANWFFTTTALGRIVELALFIVLTAAITWLVHFPVNAFGSLVNATPLIGCVSRALGACLELFVYAMVLYFIYAWLLPWLISLIPQLAVVNTLFTSSKYVLPVIADIGSLVWYTALEALSAR